jgi:hypothetical protein
LELKFKLKEKPKELKVDRHECHYSCGEVIFGKKLTPIV